MIKNAINPNISSYALVNGLKLYYEIHGTGEPLVLLHGGVGASEMFSPSLPALSATRQVIAVHLQAHGRTADIDRPLRFEWMADDIAALIKRLGFEMADLLGYSLGGGVALQTAIRHPNVVRKLIVVSAPIKRQGWYPEVLESMTQMDAKFAEFIRQSAHYQLYPEVNWEALFTKLGDLSRQDYDWSQEVAALKCPVMLAFADADAVRTAHVMEFFMLLGGGLWDASLNGFQRPVAQLAILPGITHRDMFSLPALTGFIAPFLDLPMPGAE